MQDVTKRSRTGTRERVRSRQHSARTPDHHEAGGVIPGWLRWGPETPGDVLTSAPTIAQLLPARRQSRRAYVQTPPTQRALNLSPEQLRWLRQRVRQQ